MVPIIGCVLFVPSPPSVHTTPTATFSFCFLLPMPAVWLKQDGEGAQSAKHFSVAAATRHLKTLGVKICHWAEQVRRLAGRDGTKDGGCFSFTDPTVVMVSSPARPARPPSGDGIPSVFTSPNKACPGCDANLSGHIKQCLSWDDAVHELCGASLPTGFNCYLCVCIACKGDMIGPIKTCSKCKVGCAPILLPLCLWSFALPLMHGAFRTGPSEGCKNGVSGLQCAGGCAHG